MGLFIPHANNQKYETPAYKMLSLKLLPYKPGWWLRWIFNWGFYFDTIDLGTDDLVEVTLKEGILTLKFHKWLGPYEGARHI